MMRKSKDVFETPTRPRTRSMGTLGTPVTPSAPRKAVKAPPKIDDEEVELNIDKPVLQREHDDIRRQLYPELWLHEEDVSEETILQKLQAYRDEYRNSLKNVDDHIEVEEEELLQEDVLQVTHMEPEAVMTKIAALRVSAQSRGYFLVPSREGKSQYFSQSCDSWILLRDREVKRREKVGSKLYKITHALLTQIYDLCTEKKHMQLHEIFYANQNLYKKAKKVPQAVDDICCMINCTRDSLYVSASENGLIYGDMYFTLDGKVYDCRSGGYEGITIPSNCSLITEVKSYSSEDEKALYWVLVVEKDTVFKRLTEDGFCEKYHCIMITGKGMPSVDTRICAQIVSDKLQLPAFALVDGNPYGLRIYSVYRYGSKKMSYNRDQLIIPKMQLLGVRYSHIDKFQVPKQQIQKLTGQDAIVARELMSQDHLEEYHPDLESMIEDKRKIQIEALYQPSFQYFAKVALPLILEEKLTSLQLKRVL